MPSKLSHHRSALLVGGLAAAVALAWAPPSDARVTRIVVDLTHLVGHRIKEQS